MTDDAHPEDREWTHDPLERSFFSTVGKGYAVGIVVFGLFGFLVARTQAPEWGFGAAIGAALFVAVFAGILGGVVLIGLWAMKNEELIRGNETGHAPAVDVAHGAPPAGAEGTAPDDGPAGGEASAASEATDEVAASDEQPEPDAIAPATESPEATAST